MFAFLAGAAAVWLVASVRSPSAPAPSSSAAAAKPGGSGRPAPGPPSDTPKEAPGSGKWREARSAVPGADTWKRPEAAEALMGMPYLQGYRSADGRVGTIKVPDPGAVQPGLNLYTSGHAPEATLMDEDGRVLHRWGYPLERFQPALFKGDEAAQIRKIEYFRRARLLPDGSLLGIYEGLGVVKLTPRSRPVWTYHGGAHHDLDIAPDGTIWVLDREGKLIPQIDPKNGVLEDFVTVLDPDDGHVLRKISILQAFEHSDYAALLERLPHQADILHTNTIEILDGRLADRNPAFRKGNLLISVLELDTVAVLDPDTETIVWALAGMWRKQHQPTILDDGNLLIFDNLGGGPTTSRVLELDPFTQRIAWRYDHDLFSKTLGTAQRLANGNTLITESENGRAIEVEPDGTIAWEFLTPHRVAKGDGSGAQLVAVLFEVVRLPPDFPYHPAPRGASAESAAGDGTSAGSGPAGGRR